MIDRSLLSHVGAEARLRNDFVCFSLLVYFYDDMKFMQAYAAKLETGWGLGGVA